jgi:Flp pilus assembly protein TadG
MKPIENNDEGAGMILAVVILTGILLIVAAGMIIDGSRVLTARRHATWVAYETARAGAQQVGPNFQTTGVTGLDPAATDTAARTAFAGLASGSKTRLASVTVTATDVIVVVSEPASSSYPLMGSSTIKVTGRARIIQTAAVAP